MQTTVNALVTNRSRLFWFLQIAGWLSYGMAAYAGAVAHDKPADYKLVLAIIAVQGFFITLIMRLVYREFLKFTPILMLMSSLVFCYLMALVWRVFTNNTYVNIIAYDNWKLDTWFKHIEGVTGSFYVLLCWSALYFGIKYYQEFQAQSQQTLQATSAAHQAQLKMLRYQLNPHFLFNTLNAISTLILDRDNNAANATVTKLSDFLRYTLDNDPNNQVSLGKELEAIDLYLEIEKVRFGKRLRIVKEIELSARSALVPSLILQPLIENAIKYAITPKEEGGTLRIGAEVHNRTLSMTVIDDGPGMSASAKVAGRSCGVGLTNTRERLQHLYGDNQAFTLSANKPSGLIATLNVPYETR